MSMKENHKFDLFYDEMIKRFPNILKGAEKKLLGLFYNQGFIDALNATLEATDERKTSS